VLTQESEGVLGQRLIRESGDERLVEDPRSAVGSLDDQAPYIDVIEPSSDIRPGLMNEALALALGGKLAREVQDSSAQLQIDRIAVLGVRQLGLADEHAGPPVRDLVGRISVRARPAAGVGFTCASGTRRCGFSLSRRSWAYRVFASGALERAQREGPPEGASKAFDSG
jgi:hypothetical protein